MTDEQIKTNLSIVDALADVTQTSIKNDQSLLELCTVIADAVHLLEARINTLETQLRETRGQILALSHFLQDKLKDEFEIH